MTHSEDDTAEASSSKLDEQYKLPRSTMENKTEEKNMDTDTPEVDQTRHKSAYAGTPIRKAAATEEAVTGYESDPRKNFWARLY